MHANLTMNSNTTNVLDKKSNTNWKTKNIVIRGIQQDESNNAFSLGQKLEY